MSHARPVFERSFLSRLCGAVATTALLFGVCTGCARSDAPHAAASAQLASASAPNATSPGSTSAGASEASREARHALLEIRVELEVDAPAGDARRIAFHLDGLARERGGFVTTSSFGDGAAHVTLRVPADAIPAVRAVVARAGPIARERRTATDVTDAIADVDARAHVAHQEETRLLKLLDEKTASLADVLAAERALAEVREKIERIDAEQRVAHGRVDLATVDVTIRIPATDAPVVGRLEDAARDGVIGARDASIVLAAFALRAGPTSLLLAALGWLLFAASRRIARRMQRDRLPSRA